MASEPGIRLHPRRSDWDDLSDYVAHFTKDGPNAADEDNPSAYKFVSILRSGVIEARTKYGIGRNSKHSPPTVCFSDAPVHHLKRVAERRSPYGLGFHKDFIVRRGGGPVLYAYRDQGDAIADIVHAARNEPDHPIWRAVPFIDQPHSNYAFEWEREWRVPADLKFHPNQVRFITVPEEDHDRIRVYFAKEEAENAFPAYRCPLIDLKWNATRIKDALKD